MLEQLKKIEEDALKEIELCRDRDSLEKFRIKYLGRKGAIAEIMRKIGKVPPSERPHVGSFANEVKSNISSRLDERIKGIIGAEETTPIERVDITLPGISRRLGKSHPITRAIDEICDIFISLGFRVVEGPEVETEYYNFEALNIPLEHPSRDVFDTFYIEGDILLRSHTSPVQVRFMEKSKPPFSIVVPGKVYRPDATDASHSFMFHQVEGLVVGKKISFSDLKGVLSVFSKQIFGAKTRMRFRPHFFPFTEPSAEVDISCIICGGKGCSVCSRKGWLEILGSGMVNPKVFEAVGYDPKEVTGFAFGMGVERIAMLKYGIDDIRLFFENDMSFLRQF